MFAWVAHLTRTMATIALAIGISNSSWAASITFQITGIASGTIGTTVFSNTPLRFIGAGDSLTAIPVDVGVTLIPLEAVSVRLAGAGAFDAVDAFFFFVNQGIPGAGFINVLIGDVFDFDAPEFASYDGTSAIGPLSGATSFLAPFNTSSGLLSIDSIVDSKFLAVLGADVPEPATIALALVGVLGAGLARGRRPG
jgi:PEP-CTERM motif